MNPMRLWLLVHSHKEGLTIEPFISEGTEETLEPMLFDIAVSLDINYEEGNDEENLELAGPFPLEPLPHIEPRT
jgi:hypothetical protein